MPFDNLKKSFKKDDELTPDPTLGEGDTAESMAAKGWEPIVNSVGNNLKNQWDEGQDQLHRASQGDLQALKEIGIGHAMGTIGSGSGLKPNNSIRELAKEYMESRGLKDVVRPYAKVDPSTGAAIAKAYEAMPHSPSDPATKSAYQALIDETLAQYQKVKELGLNIEKIKPGMENPYTKGSSQVFDDINKNKHLWYYPTESGFGTQNAITDNPLLAKTSEMINGEPMLANDVFRVVHDVMAHGKEGLPFGPRGEENAWREHSLMYSPEALKALTSETRGQNSWVNYGPHGEANRASPGNTIYADQKSGILPDWALSPEGAPPQSKFSNVKKFLKDLWDDERGALGDWKKEGITFKHTPGDIHTVDALNPNGDIIGSSSFYETPHGIEPETIEVNPSHQRKGIASEMYRLMEDKLGKKVVPSLDQSDEAKALWNSSNRPFGSENPYSDLWERKEKLRQESIKDFYKRASPEYLKKLESDIAKMNANKPKMVRIEEPGLTPGSTTISFVPEGSEEARAFLAKQSGLDMSEAARMQRAKDMGFDTEKTLYHGTPNNNIEEFKILPKTGKNGAAYGNGVYFTDNPSTASTYASYMNKNNPTSEGANVIPVHAKLENPFNLESPVDAEFKELLKNESKIPKNKIEEAKTNFDLYGWLANKMSKSDMTNLLKKAGYDGLQAPHAGTTVVFDPSQIRSKFAAFDPSKSGSGNISAGLAGAGLLGAQSAYDNPRFKLLRQKLQGGPNE